MSRSGPPRGQWFVALVVVAVVAAAGVTLQNIGPAPATGSLTPGSAPSGEWYCPHGGGEGWSVSVSVANPGNEAVQVRVSTFGESGPGKIEPFSLAAGASRQVRVPAVDRGAATTVAFFGGWVGAGWAAVAGGQESGVAAEPCSAAAGTSFLTPDNSTADKTQNAFVIVMNPFPAEAVVSLSLYSEKGPVQQTGSALTDFLIKPEHTHAFRLNDFSLDDTTLGVRVQARAGRVAVASLGISSSDGGVRSSIGVPTSSKQWILPGGKDGNRAALAMLNVGSGSDELQAILYGESAELTAAGANGQSVERQSAVTFPVVTTSPSTIVLHASESQTVAARRTFGIDGDEGSTMGATSFGTDWVVMPAVGPEPSEPRLLLTADQDSKVTLTLLGPEGVVTSPAPIIVTVPASRTVLAPVDFTNANPAAPVLVHAESGSVVPVFAAYSQDRAGYAVSSGIQMPNSQA